LTGGRIHITDYSNASRTMLFNIKEKCWDNEILKFFNIPIEMLPEVKDSSGFYGNVDAGIFGNTEIPLSGMAGDQQAALFGQTCFKSGAVKTPTERVVLC